MILKEPYNKSQHIMIVVVTTYQVLANSHQEKERNSLSSYSYESVEFAVDHFHQEGWSPLGLLVVLAYNNGRILIMHHKISLKHQRNNRTNKFMLTSTIRQKMITKTVVTSEVLRQADPSYLSFQWAEHYSEIPPHLSKQQRNNHQLESITGISILQ